MDANSSLVFGHSWEGNTTPVVSLSFDVSWAKTATTSSVIIFPLTKDEEEFTPCTQGSHPVYSNASLCAIVVPRVVITPVTATGETVGVLDFLHEDTFIAVAECVYGHFVFVKVAYRKRRLPSKT